MDAQMKHPNLFDIHETPHQAITESMKKWIAKVKLQATVSTSGQELWEKSIV